MRKIAKASLVNPAREIDRIPQRASTSGRAAGTTALGMRGTVAASADEAGEAQRPQVQPQPPPKQRRRRISHKLEFKLKLVKLALARPRGHRIKPVCREFPEVEPVRRRPRPRAPRCPHLPLSALPKLHVSCDVEPSI